MVFVPLLCLLGGLAVALTQWPLSVRLAIAALLATTGTYSYANGLLCWPLLLFPLLLPLSQERGEFLSRWRTASLIWLSLAVAEIGFYFYGYQKPAGAQPFTLSGETVGHALAFWGSPLTRWTDDLFIAESIGVALASVFFMSCVYVFQHRRDESLIRRALPWIVMGTYTLASGAIAAVGRSADGARQALAGRYTTFGVGLAVGMTMLIPIVARHFFRQYGSGSRSRGRAAAIVATLMIGTQLLAFDRAMIGMGLTRILRLQEKASLQWCRFSQDDPALGRTYPNVERLVERAAALDKLGLLSPPLVPRDSLAAVMDDERSGDAGRFLSCEPLTDGSLSCRGWAVLPERVEMSDAVLITATHQGERPVFAGMSTLKYESENAAHLTRQAAYGWSGFEIVFPAARVPHGWILTAWSWDATTGRAHQIEGSFPVP